MNNQPLKMVLLGLSITSSWGNGHATTYRGLVRELVARGHDVLFLERDMPWYAEHRDLPPVPGRTELYSSLDDLKDRFASEIRSADFVMVGSYVPEGAAVGEWVLSLAGGATAFYDLDTPITLANLEHGSLDYISAELMRQYQIYFSFTGGPILERLQTEYGVPLARALYGSADPQVYYPEETPPQWDLGYLGTYSADRQPAVQKLVLETARRWVRGRFVIAGPQYPNTSQWPPNVQRIEHLPPGEHRPFYNQQRFTLNLTRSDMIAAGYSPNVRLFEAAACGTAIISDYWEGLETIFETGDEVLIARDTEEVLRYVREIPERERVEFGRRARARVLAEHTSAHRAAELEAVVHETLSRHVVAAA